MAFFWVGIKLARTKKGITQWEFPLNLWKENGNHSAKLEEAARDNYRAESWSSP